MIATFQLGVLTEAFAQAYRTTQDPRIKEKMIAMARFVEKYGLDPKYDYAGGLFGLKNGVIWHDYSANGTVDFWDPVYTTSLVNTLAWGYRLTGDEALKTKAFHFYDRGNKGIYGEPVKRTAADGVIHHFIDSRFSTAMEGLFLDYNRGELQYSWVLFDRTKPGEPIFPRAPRSGFRDWGIMQQRGEVVFTGLGLGENEGAFITDLQGNLIARLGREPMRGEGYPTLRWNASHSPSGAFLLTVQSREGMRSTPFLLRK
jgi:hypothetical protein